MRINAVSAMGCALLLAGCITSGDAGAPTASVAGDGQAAASAAEQLAKCDKPLGTASIAEPDANTTATLQSLGLQSPTPMLRIMMAQSNCFRIIDSTGTKARAARWTVTPNLIASAQETGGLSSNDLTGGLTRNTFLGNLSGGISTKEAQTALFLIDSRSGEQLAAAQGKGQGTDFNATFAGDGHLLDNVGAYGKSPEGKVIMAAYADALNKLVAQMKARRHA
jgi:curli biogenesis system outer membrane secretion channel CsgG